MRLTFNKMDSLFRAIGLKLKKVPIHSNKRKYLIEIVGPHDEAVLRIYASAAYAHSCQSAEDLLSMLAYGYKCFRIITTTVKIPNPYFGYKTLDEMAIIRDLLVDAKQ